MPWRQAAHEQQVNEQIEIACCGFGINAKVAGELGGVEQTALMVGKHAPEAAQGFGSDARAELWDIALQIGADEILPPAQAACSIGSEQAFRKAAANPYFVSLECLRFQYVEGCKLEISDAPCQCFAGLFEQFQGC